jgi:O-acetylhomoserine/O-acetylserine sulfhydrylase
VHVGDAQSHNQISEYQFTVTFKKFGIGVKWVTEGTPEAFTAAIDEKTKAIFVESIANPKFILSDIPVLAKVI